MDNNIEKLKIIIEDLRWGSTHNFDLLPAAQHEMMRELEEIVAELETI